MSSPQPSERSAGGTFRSSGKTYQIIGVMPRGFGLRMIDQSRDTQFYALIQKDEEWCGAPAAKARWRPAAVSNPA